MVSSKKGALLGGVSTFLSALLGVPAAHAQATPGPSPSAAQNNTVLGEVIVTAQKRSESLQSVPVTVTAVGSKLMAAVSTPSIQDLNMVVPGLDMQAQGSYTLPSLRGVSTTLTTLGNEPNVAIYVDGVYYPVSFSNFMRFSDIDHVEVLKGPQGTLFGHNATGGAINIITKTPSSSPTGDFSVAYGRFNDVEFNGYLSGALTDTLSGNIAFYGHRDSGWTRNIFLNTDDTATRGAGVRAKLVYQPSTTFKATLSIDNSMEDNPPANFNLGGDSALSAAGAVVASQLGETATNFPISNRIYQTGGSLIIESNHDNFDIISVSGGRYAQAHGHFDIDNTSLPVVELFYGPKSVSGSEDLRVQSPNSAARLTWVAGLNLYYDTDSFNPFDVILDGAPLPQFGETKTKSGGVYGQATYKVTDRASITLGGRLSREEVRESFSSPADGVPYTAVTKDWGDFSPKFTLDYQFAAGTKGYFTISKGYKGGAFNVGSFQTTPIQPETLWDYEVGLKSDLSSHLRANLAAFYYDYKDLQVQAFGALAVTPIDTNAPKARMYGLDADVTARYGDLLIDGDTLDIIAGISLLHSEYVDYPGATLAVEQPGGGDAIVPTSADGKALVTAPKFTLNFAPSYAVRTQIGRFTFTPAIYYNSGFFLDALNSPRFKQSAFTRLNATVNWDSPDGRYYVQVWGRNLTSVKELGGILASALGPVANGYPPAWYGVTLGYHF